MNSQSDNYRLNLILKDFQEGKIDKSIIDIRNYLKKFPNDDVGKFNFYQNSYNDHSLLSTSDVPFDRLLY